MLETLLREMDEEGVGEDAGETVVHDNDQVSVVRVAVVWFDGWNTLRSSVDQEEAVLTRLRNTPCCVLLLVERSRVPPAG